MWILVQPPSFSAREEGPNDKDCKRSEAQLKAFINHLMIKCDSIFIHFTDPIRKYAAPGKGKTKDAKAKRLCQHQVIFIPIIKIASLIRFGASFDLSLTSCKYIPDRKTPVIYVICTLVLGRCNRYTP